MAGNAFVDAFLAMQELQMRRRAADAALAQQAIENGYRQAGLQFDRDQLAQRQQQWEAEAPYRQAQTAEAQARADELKNRPQVEAGKDAAAQQKLSRQNFIDLLKGGETYGMAGTISGYQPDPAEVQRYAQEAISAGLMKANLPDQQLQVPQGVRQGAGAMADLLAGIFGGPFAPRGFGGAVAEGMPQTMNAPGRAKTPQELSGEVMGQSLPAVQALMQQRQMAANASAARAEMYAAQAKYYPDKVDAQIREIASRADHRLWQQQNGDRRTMAEEQYRNWQQKHGDKMADIAKQNADANATRANKPAGAGGAGTVGSERRLAITAANGARQAIQAYLQPLNAEYKSAERDLSRLQESQKLVGEQLAQLTKDPNPDAKALAQTRAQWAALAGTLPDGSDGLVARAVRRLEAVKGEMSDMRGKLAALPDRYATSAGGAPAPKPKGKPNPAVTGSAPSRSRLDDIAKRHGF